MKYGIEINGTIDRWTADYVSYQLSRNKGAHVDMRINSLGGDLMAAVDIASRLHEHGDVTAHLHGFCASAATVLSLGCKEVKIDDTAFYLVHKVSNAVLVYDYLNADQMEDLVKELQKNIDENTKIDIMLSRMYAKKCKRKCDEIMNILTEGAWLTAKEAKSYGFVDEVVHSLTEAEQLANKVADMGLPPLPKIEKPGLFDKIRNFLNNKNMKEVIMNHICRVLNVQNLQVGEDNTVSMTEAQLQSIENEIATSATAVETANARIAELEASEKELQNQIAALKNQSQDDPDNGNHKKDEEQAMSANDMFNKIKNLI